MIYIIIGLSILNLILIWKLFDIRHDIKSIGKGFTYRISEDTNTLITVKSGDTAICSLAGTLNSQLRSFRTEKNKYVNGNRELKNAVTNISHDIRTPLTAIIGYLDLIKKTDDKEAIKKYLPIIYERSISMKQLTEELFSFSMDTLGAEGEIETEDVNLNKLLEDSIMAYYGALTEKGISPKVNIPEEKVIRKLNATYVSRIFSNLLNNAVKYSEGDLEINLEQDGTILFSNYAPGLTGVDVEKLFDRFYTVETAHNSTGLGLSIVKLLTERQGGSIASSFKDNRLEIKIVFKS